MSRTLTAMFDSRAEAEAAKSRLEAANIDINRVHVHDQGSTGHTESSAYSTHQNRGFWDSVKSAFLPDEDRHTYEEGIRRGGALLTAEVDEDNADEAMRILDNANSIDIDERAGQWRQSGWDYDASRQASTGTGPAMGMGAAGGADMTHRLTTGRTDTDERIDVVEEELVVGKREVNRGGVRVRSYVREVPVHEQVSLREETVHVERRPVEGRSATDLGADAFREREIAMTETAEEAVVGKNARVVEEVVVHKEAHERTEQIHDTVRRTEVDIDNAEGSRTGGMSTGGTGTGGTGTGGTGTGGTGTGGTGLGSTGLGGTRTDRDRF